MSSLNGLSNANKMQFDDPPLPRLGGPKLKPFRGTATADIDFVEFIGDDEDMDSKVWKVCIDGKVFALKVFPFQNWKYLKETQGCYVMPQRFDPLHRPEPTPQEWVDYLDPFNCECRAYGRLKEEHREELAVRAHGYLLLSKGQERYITEAMGHYVDWENHPEPLDCSGLFYRWEAHRHLPLRAIVKDYIESSGPWTASQIPKMYSDLEELHKLGILVRDIHTGNYLEGKLVDFSMAWTMYHICIDRVNPARVKEIRSEDLYDFEQMVDDWAFYHQEKIEKPEGLMRHHSGQEEDFGYDPRLYKWQKRMEGDEE